MTQLSVNINKIATLRNARGGNVPHLEQVALDIVDFGANGITVHPRPDERHIRRHDVYQLKAALQVELNIEGYPNRGFLDLISRSQPAQCTLVPDPPDVLTSNAGWRVQEQLACLQEAVREIKRSPIRISVFIDPLDITPKELEQLKEMSVDRIELFTERYARFHGTPEQHDVLASYVSTANMAKKAGLWVNAGHDLNQKNLGDLITAIPFLAEVSIGHELICEALYSGLEKTVQNYREICQSHSSLSTS